MTKPVDDPGRPSRNRNRKIATVASTAFLLGSIGWYTVHRSGTIDRRSRSEAARERVVLAASNLPRQAAEHLFAEESRSLLPDDRLLARLHLAKAALRSDEFLRLLDSAGQRGLTPAESLEAWRMLPLEASLARRVVRSKPSSGNLDSIAPKVDVCLARDSTLLDCHLAGILAAFLDRNWHAFDRRTDRALDLRPGDFRLQGFRGIELLLQGDVVRARSWIPDARYQAPEGAPYGELFEWSARIFQPWRELIDGPASDSACRRMGIDDSICQKIASKQAADIAVRPEGLLACSVAPDTYGEVFLCHPQTEVASYPLHGRDPIPKR